VTGQVAIGGYAETPLEPGTLLWFTPGLATGDAGHLADAEVHVARRSDAERFGMCGRLTLSTGDPTTVPRTDPSSTRDSQEDFR
jgi:hypothetical protein